MRIIVSIFALMSFGWALAQHDTQQTDLKVGLVLSGGGAKGLAHIGVLKVLEEAGVRVDYVGGTSMGAIVGAMYAAGYSAKELDSIFQQLDFQKILQDEISRRARSLHERYLYDRYAVALPFNNFKLGFPRAVSKGQNLYNEFVRLLYPVSDTYDFSKLSIPFLCVATNIETGKEVLLESGFLPKAIMASGSFPSLFDLVEIDGQLLTDGGVVNNYPVDEIKAKGVDIIIGVDVQSALNERDKLASVFGVLSQISSFPMVNDMCEKSQKTDVYIKPDIEGFNVISFEKGRIIIENGETEARKHFERLKEIALKQRKSERFVQPVKKVDSFYLKDVHFHGNEHYSRSYLRGKLHLKELDKKISFQQLENGISNLMATRNFHSIHHQIRHTEQGEHIDFLIRENPERTFLKFGLHYDNLFKTGFLLNYTKHYALQTDDFLSLDVVVGDNFRYQFDYFVDKGFYISYGFRSKLNQFYRKIDPSLIANYDIEVSKINKLNVDAFDLVNQLYFQTLLGNGFVFGLGLEHRKIKIETENVFYSKNDVQMPYRENSHFGSTYAYLKYDSFNNAFFPTRGVYFNSHFNLYLLGSAYENFNQFSIGKAELGVAIPLFPRVTTRLTFDGGFTLGNSNVYSLDFFFGGYNKNAFSNYIPFYGYDFLSFGEKNYLKADLTLDINHYKKHHILLHANVAKVDNNLFESLNWKSYPDFSGYGIGYSIDSFLGPVELKCTYSPELKKAVWFFNVGYWF
ncbi:patatin-like phospholipase family protein [Capnocytophaga sp.]|uniref:patatin-like phospholipase family protein n=1 Tax=Capnocytophaga sp. TaxID=44737 RepID=UPI0026DAABB4|nr:patatin-like phospholipase family protein [Capnocytophaga sp.]MDO5106368.1 patatin-like phospholipase family protein [Capnocytophaga sp.]